MNVLLTRDAAGIARWKTTLLNNSEFAEKITIYELPTIKIVPRKLTPHLAHILTNLRTFDLLIFTSANGVRAFAKLCKSAGILIPSSLNIAAIGPQTEASLTRRGMSCMYTSETPSREVLANSIPVSKGDRVLVVCGNLAHAVAEILSARSAEVTEAVVYDTEIIHMRDTESEKLFTSNTIDGIVFTSPSSVQGFCERISGEALTRAKRMRAASIGPTTSRALSDAGFSIICEAESPSLDGMLRKLLY